MFLLIVIPKFFDILLKLIGKINHFQSINKYFTLRQVFPINVLHFFNSFAFLDKNASIVMKQVLHQHHNQFKQLNMSFTQQILQISQSITKNFNKLCKFNR